jgi:uncharacterized BrkB/YihY/UPF0761 family membrane protein
MAYRDREIQKGGAVAKRNQVYGYPPPRAFVGKKFMLVGVLGMLIGVMILVFSGYLLFTLQTRNASFHWAIAGLFVLSGSYSLYLTGRFLHWFYWR